MAVAAHTSDTARVEAFSDGVFAIAITLLVLEIHVPAPDATQHGRTLLTALRQLWPSYLGYALSFVTIGIMWANHHSIFRYVRRADRYFLQRAVSDVDLVPAVPHGFARRIPPRA